MRVSIARLLLILPLAGLALALPAPRPAEAGTVNAVYAFAQQKVYGMTIDHRQQHARVVGDPLGYAVKMTSAATSDGSPGILAKNGGLDVGVSYLPYPSFTPPATTGTATGNNFVWNTPNSSAPGEVVLKQALPTTPLHGKGVTLADLTGQFAGYGGQGFSRGDAYATVPDTAPIPGTTTNAAAPAGPSWPAAGSGVAIDTLFAPIGSAGALSIDSVAEALLTNADHDSIASGVADWVVTGKFGVESTTSGEHWADVSLTFQVAERMVVYSYQPLLNISTASNSFAFDITDDATGLSVFGGGVTGLNPSTTRLLSSPRSGSMTYNNWTAAVTDTYPGASQVEFTAFKLTAGEYTFTIKGSSTAYVSAVPEPGTHVALALGGAMAAAGRLHRRMRRAAPPAGA